MRRQYMPKPRQGWGISPPVVPERVEVEYDEDLGAGAGKVKEEVSERSSAMSRFFILT